MIRAVAGLGPVTVISFGGALDEQAAADLAHAAGPGVTVRLVPPVWRYAPWRLVQGLLGPSPFHVAAERSPAFRRALAAVVADCPPDLILCENVSMYDQLCELDTEAPVIIDTHNLDSLVLERYAQSSQAWHRRVYARVSARKLARFERYAFRAADAVVVCSGIERAALAASLAGLDAWVVPNGADVGHFEPRPEIARMANRLLFFGRLDYYPNQDAIDYFIGTILPLIMKERREVEFHIAGAGGGADFAARVTGTPGVVYHGRVDDLAALVSSAAVVVVPLRSGGGTRLKILEALAVESPVVSTTVGAEGLNLTPGEDLLLADDPASFAAAVCELLGDRPAAAELGRRGCQTVRERFDWRAIETDFRALVCALQHRRARSA